MQRFFDMRKGTMELLMVMSTYASRHVLRAPGWLLIYAALLGVAVAQPGGYAPGVVIAQYRADVIGSQQTITITPQELLELQARESQGRLTDDEIPRYTNDARTNRALLAAGVQRSQRLFASAKLPVPAAYRLTIVGRSVQSAIARLRAAPGIASVTPDWYVSPLRRR